MNLSRPACCCLRILLQGGWGDETQRRQLLESWGHRNVSALQGTQSSSPTRLRCHQNRGPPEHAPLQMPWHGAGGGKRISVNGSGGS